MKRIKEEYYNYLQRNGIRNSKQREKILDIFLETKSHLTIAELYNEVRNKHTNIGQATIYRAMKIICESGIAEEIDLGDGTKRFELKHGQKHHDHLICLSCGKIIEVINDEIEKLQDVMCNEYNFTAVSHKLQIFGYCPDCK